MWIQPTAASARTASSLTSTPVRAAPSASARCSPPPGGWRILIAEDSRVAPDSDGQVICVGSGGVATSSTTVRRWTRGGTVLHHIIDPATGLPTVGPWRTVTVVAASAVDANIAATAAIEQGVAAIDRLTNHW